MPIASKIGFAAIPKPRYWSQLAIYCMLKVENSEREMPIRGLRDRDQRELHEIRPVLVRPRLRID